MGIGFLFLTTLSIPSIIISQHGKKDSKHIFHGGLILLFTEYCRAHHPKPPIKNNKKGVTCWEKEISQGNQGKNK